MDKGRVDALVVGVGESLNDALSAHGAPCTVHADSDGTISIEVGQARRTIEATADWDASLTDDESRRMLLTMIVAILDSVQDDSTVELKARWPVDTSSGGSVAAEPFAIVAEGQVEFGYAVGGLRILQGVPVPFV